MSELNLDMTIGKEVRWWGVRLLIRLPDSDLTMRARREGLRSIMRDRVLPSLRPLLGLRFWQILTYRVEDWGREVSSADYVAAVEKRNLALFERSK